MCEMSADEWDATNWLKEEEYGGYCPLSNGLKTGRNRNAAVCNFIPGQKRKSVNDGKNIWLNRKPKLMNCKKPMNWQKGGDAKEIRKAGKKLTSAYG